MEDKKIPIEHVNIPDDGRHEPKGASTAPLNFVLASNGDTTTSWKNSAEIIDPSKFVIETVLGSESSAISQVPGAADTAIQLEFGPASGGPTDPVQLALDGTVTFNVTGLYRIRILATIGQTAGTGDVRLMLRPLLNGSQAGRSIVWQVPAKTLVNHVQESWFPFAENDEFTYELYVDSAGTETVGGAYKITPTIGGWADAPSAVIEVARFVPLGA